MSVPELGAFAHPQREFDAAVGTLLVRLGPSPERQIVTDTAEQQPSRVATEATPEDTMPAFGDVHSQTSWVGGEGLFDRFRNEPGPNDEVRYWDSQGIDVSPTAEATPDQIRLLTTAAQVDAIADTVRIAHAGTSLWATSSQTLRKTTDILAATPGFAADDPHAGEAATDVEDVATLGDIPYAALGANGIHRDSGGWSHWADVAAVRVWSVRDRIVASTGPALYEAGSGATSVLLYTLPSGETWTDVTDAGEAVIASATNGFVYVFTLNDAAELEVTGQSRMKGEQPQALAHRGGVVWIATQDGDSARLWQADGASLDGLQLLREWPDADVRDMTVTRDRLYIGVTEVSTAWVWRLELSTSGLYRAHQLGSGTIDGLEVVEGVTVAGVSTDGVWRETVGELVDEGWLIGPMSDFFRADDKSWVSYWVEMAVDLGEKVTLYFTTDRAAMTDPDHDSWQRLRTFSSTPEPTETSVGREVSARSLAAMVRLSRSSSHTSPQVRAIAFRSFPRGGDILVRLPVDVGDQVERHGRRRMLVAGMGQATLEALREREGSSQVVRIFRTDETVRGLVERVSTPIPALTRRGSATVVSMVTVRGQRVDASEPIDVGEWGAFGVSQFGLVAFGGELLEEV